jgi:hypothetical protein
VDFRPQSLLFFFRFGRTAKVGLIGQRNGEDATMRSSRLLALTFLALGFAGFHAAAEATDISAVGVQKADLALRLLPKAEKCTEAEMCAVTIHIINEGGEAFEGPLSVRLDLHAPAVLPYQGNSPCIREDYGKFRCDLASARLEPGASALIEPNFLFTATAFETSAACASFEWNSGTLAMRDRLLDQAIAASGHSAAELSHAAGLANSGAATRSQLLAALIGRWGNGDAFAGNDKGCTTFGIISSETKSLCASGQGLIGGRCVTLASWCPSNREKTEGGACSCPSTAPYWDSDPYFDSGSGKCLPQVALAKCPAADQDAAQFCRCPTERPVFNAAANSCLAVEVQVAAVQPEPEIVGSNPKKIEPPAKTEAVAPQPPDCAADSVWDKAKGRCIRAAEPRVRDRAVRIASVHRTTPPLPRRAVRREIRHHSVVRHDCPGLQVWGPRIQQCVPYVFYLAGRVFGVPTEPTLLCPAGYRVAGGICRKK